MKHFEYDLVVMGSGPSGRRAAIQGAKWGYRDLVIEDRAPGGVSVNTGTIPSKTVRETVLNLTGFRERNFYSHVVRDAKEDDIFGRVRTTQEREIKVLKAQLARNNIDFLAAYATLWTTIQLKQKNPTEQLSKQHLTK